MLTLVEFARFHLLYSLDPELADAALRKVAEWRLPCQEPTEKIIPSPKEAFVNLIDPVANEMFIDILRADNATPEAAFIIGRQIIRLPINEQKVRPTIDGYTLLSLTGEEDDAYYG